MRDFSSNPAGASPKVTGGSPRRSMAVTTARAGRSRPVHSITAAVFTLTAALAGCSSGAEPGASTVPGTLASPPEPGPPRSAPATNAPAPVPTPASPTAAEKQCTGDNANSELPCNLKEGRMGWCKGGVCKDICPAGLSYNALDAQCHQRRDCKPSTSPDGILIPLKTPQCDECMDAMCMDPGATRPIKD